MIRPKHEYANRKEDIVNRRHNGSNTVPDLETNSDVDQDQAQGDTNRIKRILLNFRSN